MDQQHRTDIVVGIGPVLRMVKELEVNIQFKKLEAADVETLVPYFFRRSNISCDSTIFDSYLWRDFYQVEFAIVDENILLMKMQEEGETYGALPLCSEEYMQEGFCILEKYFREQRGEPLRIYGADEAGVELLKPELEAYQIREQVDQADYIYDAYRLRTLSGSKYHKKKNNVNAFLKAYEGRWEYRTLTENSADEIWQFLKRWRSEKETNVEEHLQAEMCGLKNYLRNMKYFKASMAGIYIDGQLEAFTIGTYNPKDQMSIVHVEKANGEIRGLYTLINREFQLREFPDAVLVNREDDLGLPSLRKAKQSYHPINMCRKFDIAPKEV